MGDPVTMMLISTAMGAVGQFQEGAAQEDAADFKAKEAERAGVAKYAEATRASAEEARKGRMVSSDAIAAMAAQGGSTTDAGAVEALGKIGEQTEYNALAALYEGESAMHTAGRQADQYRIEGQQKANAARMQGISTMLSGGSEAFTSYRADQRAEERLRLLQGKNVNPGTTTLNLYGN